jgi:hypothetical protein
MEWIDKKDRLPEEEQEILFTHIYLYNPLTDEKIEASVFGGWYRQGKCYSWVSVNSEPRESIGFTHWMPLPNPPKV